MTTGKILEELDKAIASLDKPDFDMIGVSKTIQRTCKILVALLEQNNAERAELEEDLNDLEETVEALIEENEILQVDIQIILEFLKKNKIDISYIVTKSDISQKIKGDSSE